MNVGLCLSDPHPNYIGDGSNNRTLSASRFCGRYRLVDFVLSNMVNSGVYTIGMVLNSHFQSLIGHIGMGKEWDLARKIGGVTFFPAYMNDEHQSVDDEIDSPLRRASEFLVESKAEFVVLADSSVVYNMNYGDAIEAHNKSCADITAIYSRKHITKSEKQCAVFFDIAEDGRVQGIISAADSDLELNVSLGAYIIPRECFLRLTAEDKSCGINRFSRVHIAGALKDLRVMAFEFKGYSAQICSVDTFFHYNMEMLDVDKGSALFDFGGRRIFTSRRDSPPTKYGKSADIKRSIISDGCRIDGTVENSVLCRYVEVGPGATVNNCILQEGTVIGRDVQLNCIITDRGVVITKNPDMSNYSTHPAYIKRSKHI